MKSAAALLFEGKAKLGDAIEAEVLLRHAMGGISRESLLMDLSGAAGGGAVEEYYRLLDRRACGEPLRYITGKAEFMGLPFLTDERALIPRNDTEALVCAAVTAVREFGYGRGLEIGAGSGCVSVAVSALAGIDMTAVDIDEEAIALARENAELNGVSSSVRFVLSDMFNFIKLDYITSDFDFIISNPPYIKSKDLDGLPDLRYEPRAALDGGYDGLDFYRKIAFEGRRFIRGGGSLFLEIGHDQAEEVCALLLANGYSGVNVIKDLAGRDRVVTCLKN